jgi:hypothetical protein
VIARVPGEVAFCDALSPERLRRQLEVFAELHRVSGTPNQGQAARSIVDEARAYGVDAEIFELDSLISWAGDGRLTDLNEDRNPIVEIPARTRAFGAQTPPDGVEADVAYVPVAAPRSDQMLFSHRTTAGDYGEHDLAGKIVLSADGGPDGALQAQVRGAVAHIYSWPADEDVVHEMIAGGPTPESSWLPPRIPVLGITRGDGERLVALLAARSPCVRVFSHVDSRWMRLPLAVATISGAASDDYLPVGGHPTPGTKG